MNYEKNDIELKKKIQAPDVVVLLIKHTTNHTTNTKYYLHIFLFFQNRVKCIPFNII